MSHTIIKRCEWLIPDIRMWVDHIFSNSGDQCELFNAYLLVGHKTHWDSVPPKEPYVAAIVFKYPHQ